MNNHGKNLRDYVGMLLTVCYDLKQIETLWRQTGRFHNPSSWLQASFSLESLAHTRVVNSLPTRSSFSRNIYVRSLPHTVYKTFA